MDVLVPNVAVVVIGTGILMVIESIIPSVLMQIVFVMNLLMIVLIMKLVFMVFLVICVNARLINDNY
jgi:hypothetical protein